MSSDKKSTKYLPHIGLTVGDFNGIGLEVVLKTLQDERIKNYCVPIIFASGRLMANYKRVLNMDFAYHQNNKFERENLHERKINIFNCWLDSVNLQPGKSTIEAGACAHMALEKSTEALKNGFIDAVVTAPINKHNMQSDSFQFAGHTEYYADRFGVKQNLMLLVSGSLRVGVVTGHIPLSKVSESLTQELIAEKLDILLASLKQDFGIQRPRVAVLGVNPHAGEEGLLGNEELKIINPVIKQFKEKGHFVFGALPADGLFGSLQYQKFDAILAMYHDQGLTPFKTLAFANGVNYTAGMPVVRTSPDHGTAYDIAGKNIADATSLRESLFLACDIVKNRKAHEAWLEQRKSAPKALRPSRKKGSKRGFED
ncbi:MAG: 4-hydroxythreonine-4-phosphate dehydrogenase PdxA [Bernardetiaceae bacterium]|nr:4-hydroxythreonine-4-phosphate dehydrogenase PdxA [Bernardetiaceae bacterium]